MKKSKNYIKNPVVLVLVFVVLLFAAGAVIPNSVPAASVIEIILTCFAIAFIYAKYTGENFSKKQKIWMAVAFFIVGTLSTLAVAYSGVIEGTSPEPLPAGVMGISLAFLGVISLIVYLFLGTAGKIASNSMKK
ncbi:ABZJ_00895 family protein [Candidatus Woesearchaeota archaeon]|nr:ABZJ_00895 family protein [Candidatus Woesearchaeota archaeon]